MKTKKIIFYVATGLLTIIMTFSVQMYFRNPEAIADFFESAHYPRYLVYPLAIAKILGLVAIWGNFSKWLKEWAYAGFFFAFILAFFAHYMISDGGQTAALMAFVLLIVSYIFNKRVNS